MKGKQVQSSYPQSSTLIAAWIAMLLASSLTQILWRVLAGAEPYWWTWLQSILLVALFALTSFRSALKPLYGFILILLLIHFLGYGNPALPWGLIPLIRTSPPWISWTSQASWPAANIALHLLRLTPALVVMGFLLLKGLRRSDFFLVRGEVDAPVEPSKLIGLKKSEPWTRIGSIFVAVFCAGTLFSLLLTSHPSLDALIRALPLVPAALLIAAVNAFNEEFTLRAAPLSQLLPAIGKQQALAVTTLFFGLGHFYGVPSGVLGVVLSSFLGWFLGKSLLETRGFFWAWLSHFCSDTFIFTFAAISASI